MLHPPMTKRKKSTPATTYIKHRVQPSDFETARHEACKSIEALLNHLRDTTTVMESANYTKGADFFAELYAHVLAKAKDDLNVSIATEEVAMPVNDAVPEWLREGLQPEVVDYVR